MKRIFVFAVLAGAFAVPVSAARTMADDAVIPQQNVQPQSQNPLANAAPADAEVVQPAQPRGAIGALASGAPGVAQNVQQGVAAAPQAGVAQGPAAGAPAGQAIAGQGVVAQQGVAGQAVVGQQGGVVAQQGGVVQQGVAGQAVVGQTGIVSQGTAVVGMQQSFASRMQQHMLVSQAFQHCMFFSDFQPHNIGVQAMPIGFGHGPFFGPVASDLELMSVGMVADGGPAGPIYRVTFKNNSPIAARFFRVSIIATLGQIQPSSPVVSVNVPEVAAGGVASVDVQLPAGVMTLGNGPFSQLVAVIDSFSELFETNKLNNVLTLNRADVVVVQTTTVTTGVAAPAAAGIAAPAAAGVSAPAAVAAPAVGGPAAGGPAPAPAAPQAAPAPQPGRSELDKIDLDSVSGASDLLDR